MDGWIVLTLPQNTKRKCVLPSQQKLSSFVETVSSTRFESAKPNSIRQWWIPILWFGKFRVAKRGGIDGWVNAKPCRAMDGFLTLTKTSSQGKNYVLRLCLKACNAVSSVPIDGTYWYNPASCVVSYTAIEFNPCRICGSFDAWLVFVCSFVRSLACCLFVL